MQLRVNYGTRIVDGKEVPAPVALRRFFLLRHSVDLAALTELAATIPTRENYYKSAGANQDLLDWLERNYCDSIYCRELTEEDAKQVAAFRTAHEAGQRKFGKSFPVKWLTMFLPAALRIGFYEAKERALKTILARLDVAAEIATNEKGTAYFFNVAPGKYFVTNIVPFDIGDARVLWNKEITVKPAPKNGISSGGSPVDISKDAINLNAKSIAPAATSPVTNTITNTVTPAPKGR